jgi:hypothetical protein
MKIKIYPDVEFKFSVVNKDSLHINFTTFSECNNGEIIEISERYIHKHEDPMKLIELIIDSTNRFHVMCQTYTKERI